MGLTKHDILSTLWIESEKGALQHRTVEPLSNLAHDENQNDHALCGCVWPAKEGKERALYSRDKDYIHNNFTTYFEAMMESLHKYYAQDQHRDSIYGIPRIRTMHLKQHYTLE